MAESNRSVYPPHIPIYRFLYIIDEKSRAYNGGNRHFSDRELFSEKYKAKQHCKAEENREGVGVEVMSGGQRQEVSNIAKKCRNKGIDNSFILCILLITSLHRYIPAGGNLQACCGQPGTGDV